MVGILLLLPFLSFLLDMPALLFDLLAGFLDLPLLLRKLILARLEGRFEFIFSIGEIFFALRPFEFLSAALALQLDAFLLQRGAFA